MKQQGVFILENFIISILQIQNPDLTALFLISISKNVWYLTEVAHFVPEAWIANVIHHEKDII